MATDILSQLISASIRICGLALIAFVSISAFRIRSSAARHAMWTLVLIGMLFQIPLEKVAPAMLVKPLPLLHASNQPRVIQSARPSVPAARATAPASHAREPVKFSRTSWHTVVIRIYLAISLLFAFGWLSDAWVCAKSSEVPRPSQAWVPMCSR
jgi:hypothetical protein